MKITYSEVNNYIRAYETLSQMSFNFQTSYKLSKLNRLCKTEQEFFNKELEKIIFEFAILDENGKPKAGEDKNTIMIQPEQIQNCRDKAVELENTEVTIEDIDFSLTDFDNTQIKPDMIEAIIPFIK